MDTATKTGLDAVKKASKKLVHKTAEATGQLIRNKVTDMNEYELNNSTRENRRNTKQIKISIIKRNTTKYLNY